MFALDDGPEAEKGGGVEMRCHEEKKPSRRIPYMACKHVDQRQEEWKHHQPAVIRLRDDVVRDHAIKEWFPCPSCNEIKRNGRDRQKKSRKEDRDLLQPERRPRRHNASNSKRDQE